MFLRNVGKHLSDYVALYAIRHIQGNLKIESADSFEASVGLPLYQTTRRNVREALQDTVTCMSEYRRGLDW
jgi:hypothetical protein